MLSAVFITWIAAHLLSAPFASPIESCRSLEEPTRTSCFAELARTTFRERGLDAALALYDAAREAGVICHYGFLHPIGEAAYEEFARTGHVALSPRLTACNYAFFHGFIAASYRANGDIRQALNLCRNALERELYLAAPTLEQNCFHGIGHGTVEYTAYTYHGDAAAMAESILRTCASIALDEINLSNCAAGVFHAISILMVAGDAGLSIRREDPLWLCHGQPERYRLRCYGNMHRTVVTLAPQNDFTAAVAFIDHAYSAVAAARESAIFYLAYMASDSSVEAANGGEHMYACQGINPTPSRLACIDGFAQGFMHNGVPRQEYKRALELCRLDGLQPDEREQCFSSLFYVFYRTYPPETIQNICRSIKEPYRIYCDLELGYRSAWDGSNAFADALEKAAIPHDNPTPWPAFDR